MTVGREMDPDRRARTCEKRVDTTVGVTASETEVVLREFMVLTQMDTGEASVTNAPSAHEKAC